MNWIKSQRQFRYLWISTNPVFLSFQLSLCFKLQWSGVQFIEQAIVQSDPPFSSSIEFRFRCILGHSMWHVSAINNNVTFKFRVHWFDFAIVSYLCLLCTKQSNVHIWYTFLSRQYSAVDWLVQSFHILFFSGDASEVLPTASAWLCPPPSSS